VLHAQWRDAMAKEMAEFDARGLPMSNKTTEGGKGRRARSTSRAGTPPRLWNQRRGQRVWPSPQPEPIAAATALGDQGRRSRVRLGRHTNLANQAFLVCRNRTGM
jgi:hypothetical protein